MHKFLGRKSLEGLFVFCLPESCDMEKRNGKFSAGDVNSKDGQPAVRTVSRPSKESGSPRKNFLPKPEVYSPSGK